MPRTRGIAAEVRFFARRAEVDEKGKSVDSASDDENNSVVSPRLRSQARSARGHLLELLSLFLKATQ